MKNHQMINGKLFQTNKKWCHLKQRQQNWIAEMLREFYIDFVMQHNRKPNKEEKNFILARDYREIEEKEIWIPINEVSNYFRGRISKYDKSVEKLKLKEQNL